MATVRRRRAVPATTKSATKQRKVPRPRLRRLRRLVAAARLQPRRVNKDVMTEVVQSVTSSFRRTPFVIAALIVLAIALTSTSTSGPVHSFCQTRSDALCKYFVTNYDKVLGYMIFAVAVVDIPYAYRIGSAAAALLWVYVIPEASPVEYVIQAAILHSFFRVRLEGSRFLLIAIAVFAYFCGFIVFKK
ncbi:hypothetical protein [Beihai barnacle virus 2]|uniref:hypothetical protein n=1 Tax=Beihai barnacle virus 2 TaxID=1922360 RepID=UPI00090A522D|nr:hypothetical protein [Beihai barnacle virus 2]APG77562.1 hypothetical protein [Beihai barnacle virus 2]